MKEGVYSAFDRHMPMTLKVALDPVRWARDIPAACLQATIVSIHVYVKHAQHSV
jgi:hypothetical protein